MRNHRNTALGIMAALLGASVSAPLVAAPIARTAAVMGAGACQPFVPTPDVRYNASGITNVGSTTIYVVCSVAGAPMLTLAETSGEATRLALGFSNTSSSSRSITCTARPGLATLVSNVQLVSAQSFSIGPATADFEWMPGDFGNTKVPASANFTCSLQPGMAINYIQVEYVEEI